MIVQDVVSEVRDLANEPPAGQRWSDSQLIRRVDRSQKKIIRDLKWPPGRFVFTSSPSVQEYALQEVLKIEAVYINGQPLQKTDKATLEGRGIQMYDQTGQGGGPGGLVVTNQAPALAGSQFTPQWTSQAPATYPVASSLGFPAPMASPWFAGRPPVYYCNGGNIGFVPAPIGSYTVVCDVIPSPATLQTLTDALTLPDLALDAVAWDILCDLYFSDRDISGASDLRNFAMTKREDAMKELRSWKRGYAGPRPGPKMLTQRSFYALGNNRIGNE